MIEALKNSSVVWIVLAICSLIGIPSFIFAIYTWFKGKNKKRISTEKKSYRIVKKSKRSIDRLKLFFDKKEIEDVAITQIALWNSGNEVIRKDDIASERHLCIKSKNDANILDAEIAVESETSNKFKINSVTSECIELDFEFFDKKEGIVVQVIHTGSGLDIVPDCKIIGGELLKGEKSNSKVRSIRNRIKNHVDKRIVFIVYEIILCIFLTYMSISEIVSFDKLVTIESTYNAIVDPRTSVIIGIVFSGVMTILFILFTILSIKKMFRMNIPSKLREYINAIME